MNILKLACKNIYAIKQIENCRKRLYRIAFSWSHDELLADDLVQDTLTTALQKIDQLKDNQALNAWLYTILNNKWREYLRRNRPCENIDDIVFTHDKTPEYWHARQQSIDLVQQAIEELPLNQRQVVTLVDIESMSYADVAAVLEIPVGTVMSRLSRAREQLISKLARRERMHTVPHLRSI